MVVVPAVVAMAVLLVMVALPHTVHQVPNPMKQKSSD